MAEYKYFNVYNGTNDCVINALCAINGNSWEMNYKELCNIGLKIHDMPDSDKTVTEYVKKKRWTREKILKGTTAGSFSNINQCGSYLILFSNHACAVIDGVVWDRMDSRTRKIYKAYKVLTRN